MNASALPAWAELVATENGSAVVCRSYHPDGVLSTGQTVGIGDTGFDILAFPPSSKRPMT